MNRRFAVFAAVMVLLWSGVPGTLRASTATPSDSARTLDGGPGMTNVILPSVSPEEAARVIQSRPLPPNLNSVDAVLRGPGLAEATALAPPSISELARALRNNVDLIYEYVRNNVEYYPVWGVQKGALGALLDGQGTAFDQAALMASLLWESGYSASVVNGQISLTGSQLGAWLGVSTANACAVRRLLAQGALTVFAMSPSGESGNCGPLTSVVIPHVWVKATVGGTAYHFDPSYKPHQAKTGLDLPAITGYNATTYLATAKATATVTPDYVQGIDRNYIRNTLKSYATTLTSYLRLNRPVAALDDLVGGQTIVPHDGTQLRQTDLPYRNLAVTPTEWVITAANYVDLGFIPTNFKTTLTISYAGINWNGTSDFLYGKRLTLTFSGGVPRLSLDGAMLQTGNTAPDAYTPVNVSITHRAYPSTLTDVVSKAVFIVPGSANVYLIANSWGTSGRGVAEFHRTKLDAALAAGGSPTSLPVMGPTLAILGATWAAQTDRVFYLADRLADTTTLVHHRVGIAGYTQSTTDSSRGYSYVDLPFNTTSIVSQSNDVAKEAAVFFGATMHASILESTAVQQTSTVSAVSTVKLLDIASANGYRIYNADANTFQAVMNSVSAIDPLWSSPECSPFPQQLQSYINAGRRLIMPDHCQIGELSWKGIGYFAIKQTATEWASGAIIGGGYAGGLSCESSLNVDLVNNTLWSASSPRTQEQTTGASFGDPVDMTKGHLLYARDDLSVGVGSFPQALTFIRQYSSGLRNQAGPLGKGWKHNFMITATQGSDGLQAMGEDAALDAAAAVVELMVSLDLLADTTKPLDKMVVATLGQRWFGDRLINNTVIVQQGLNGEVFVKLADDSYNAPPGNAAKLTKNANSTYTYETREKVRLDFNTAGKITTLTHPSGIQVLFTYNGNNLDQVQNSLGRTLTLGYNTAGRVTSVGDGSRSIIYTHHAATGNLTQFTDAESNATTFEYVTGTPGQLAKIFYPSNPTVAAITNVYDTLGRVQTQTDANGKLYTYYFAGTRSEEVAPDGGGSKVSYVDGLGKILKTIDPLGRVTSNTYDAQSRLTKTVLPEGNSVEYEYDDAPCAAQLRCTHNIKTVRQSAKQGSGLLPLTSTFFYESNFNQVKTATDPRGQTTDYTYTAQGLPETVTGPADASNVRPQTTTSYTLFASTFYLPTRVSSLIGSGQATDIKTTYLTTNKYVPRTVIVDEGTGKLNLTTTLTYDGVGNLTAVDGPRLPADVIDNTSFVYDNERRVTRVTDALGKQTRRGYDADGRLLRVAAMSGTIWLVSCRNYTPSGKLLKAWGPGLTSASTTCPTAAAPVPVTDYEYDNLDRLQRVTVNLTAAEGGNRVTETDYYLDGRVQAVRQAVGTALAQAETTYTYTGNGLLATVKDARNNLTTYQYDGHDRKWQVRYPDPTTAGVSSSTDFEQFGYDANGNVTTLRTRGNQQIDYGYDNLNRLVSRSYPGAPADNVAFSYDLLGRPLDAKYVDNSYGVVYGWDNAGRLTATTAGGKTQTFGYDEAGNRIRTNWPDGGFFVTATYDALNRLTNILESGNLPALATYNYDDLSRRTTVTRSNGTTTNYGYDNQAGLYNLAHDFAGTTQDVSFTYARNQAQEIKTLTWSNNSYLWTGAVPGTRPFTPNGRNQYTAAAGASLSYDGNGNLTGDGTWNYVYDAENRLRTATANNNLAVTLAWDAVGRLRQTATGGTATQLLYDGNRLVAEYDGTGALLRRYVHGPGSDEPLVKYEGAGTANKTLYYADHLGSIVATVDAAGSVTPYAYGPFGESGTTAPLRFGYTGQQYLAPLGLYHYKARFYSPAIGRFLQPDPIGYAGGINLYAYVGNNPLNRIDPRGRSASNARLFDSFADASSAMSFVNTVTDFVTGGFSSRFANSLREENYPQAAIDFTAAVIFGIGTIAGGEVAVAARGVGEFTRVGRWMSTVEFETMSNTGRVVEGAGGRTSVIVPPNPSSYTAATSGSVYVEFNVPSSVLRQGGRADWAIIPGPSITTRIFGPAPLEAAPATCIVCVIGP